MNIKRYSKLNGLEAEMKFIEDYLFASALLEYVKGISGENTWFLDECIENNSGEYWVSFKSYDSPEYKNFVLTVHVAHTDSGWDFSVQKQVTTLA